MKNKYKIGGRQNCTELETLEKKKMSLRGAQRRGNLNLFYEIASLRSQ